MFGLDQLVLLDQAVNGSRDQFLSPPEKFGGVPFLRRADRIEIEFHQFRASLSFANMPRLLGQIRVMTRDNFIDERIFPRASI